MDDTDVQKAHLGKIILKLLNEGFVLSEDVLFFAESTCGLSPTGFEAALMDPRFEQSDELLALILTPDMGVRATLEPLLTLEPIYTSAEVGALALELGQQIGAVPLHLPGGDHFNLTVDPHDIGYFVSKLYIDRRIDNRLVALLNEFFSTETVIATRLMLRCRGDVLGTDKLDFLYGFIKKSQSREEVFVDLLGLVLTLLAEINEVASLEQYLLDRRRQLIEMLKEIREFERKRDQYSMEYLMMQRYRVPHESQDQIVDQLQMLMTITDQILGLPPDPSYRTNLRNLGTYGRGSDIAEIIRVLS